MDLSFLSDVQQQAVTAGDGPVLVLAGAGSGKTSVLTHRVAYLINERNVDPYSILAITFTNKAANEMKERIQELVDFDTTRMAVSTFHSMCARFLRWDADKIGYTTNFTIYDTDDSVSVIKKVSGDLGLDTTIFPPRRLLGIISSIKNSSAKLSLEECVAEISEGYNKEIVSVYKGYVRRMERENAMDFDDLLINMLKLLESNEQVRGYYTNRFKYVLVDEYQDTNSVQYELVKILSEKHNNLFVVGDDDQSIYGWRGADVRNILNFEKDFKDVAVIKLEQNYRSHQKILDVANVVIENADERTAKKPWSANKEGRKPRVYLAQNEYAEGEFIAREISRYVREGAPYENFAVLYRTHTQARVVEEKLRAYGIPYRVFGGMSFYARKEIKDIVAYLTLVDNPAADTALLRVINTPRRGIGNITVAKLVEYAGEQDMSLLEAMEYAEHFMTGGKQKFASFLDMVEIIKKNADNASVGQIVELVYEHSGYKGMLSTDDDLTSDAKIENVEELINSAFAYEKSEEEPTLEGFLATISLITDMDTETDDGGVALMTLHGAKGLEFDTVFMAGMEENVFPSKRSVDEGKLDEERRLCYVGITRAKNVLYLTSSESRNMYSGASANPVSRFLQEVPNEMLEDITGTFVQKKAKPKTPTVKDFTYKKVEFKSKATNSPNSFKKGMRVEHPKFGKGTVKAIVGDGDQRVAIVTFADGDRKMFLSLAPLQIVS